MATKLYKQLLDNLTTAVMLIDDRFSLVYMNPAAEMLLEASERRLFHVPVRQWLMLGDEDWELLREALEHQRPFTKREAKVNSLSGHQFTVDYSVNPMLQQGESCFYWNCIPVTGGCVFPGRRAAQPARNID
ncbi:PAS domain S-box protein [Aliamphritea spongicola]|nr:PAS domain S-box protein [Aliamphritea spongicola]